MLYNRRREWLDERRTRVFGPKEIIVVLVVLLIVLMIFGPKRFKSLGSELGNAIKGFRSAVREKDAAQAGEAGDDPPADTRQRV